MRYDTFTLSIGTRRTQEGKRVQIECFLIECAGTFVASIYRRDIYKPSRLRYGLYRIPVIPPCSISP